jgi:hypothetical protein
VAIVSRSVTVIDGSGITLEVHSDDGQSPRLSHLVWDNGLADRYAVRFFVEDAQRNVVYDDIGYWQQGEKALPAIDLALVMFDWDDVYDIPGAYRFGTSLIEV